MLKPHFLSQIIQSRHTMTVMFLEQQVLKKSSKELLMAWEKALEELDSLIREICEETNERIKANVTKVKDLPNIDNREKAARLFGEVSMDLYSIENDNVIPDSIWLKYFQNEQLYRQKKKEHLDSLEGKMTPPVPSSMAKLSAEARNLCFIKSAALRPVEQIVLYQELSDEIFGYGPLGAYIRNFDELTIDDQGNFTAGSKPASLVFDSENHRSEILGLLKLVPSNSVGDYVEYELSNGKVKLRISAREARCIQDSPTQLERIGWKSAGDFQKAVILPNLGSVISDLVLQPFRKMQG